MKVETVKKLLAREAYRLCCRSDFAWRYLANLTPSLMYRRMRRPLSPLQQSLLTALRRDGIVLTSIQDFFGDLRLFEELESAVWDCETKAAEELRKAQMDVGVDGGRSKDYVVSLLGALPVLDPSSIFVRFALQPELMDIVNSYFGMLTKLRYYNVWHTFPTLADPKASQLWHRDPEDRAVLKLFVYLTDVDEEAGPLSYAPGTQARGSIKIEPESNLFKEGQTYVSRSNDTQMRAILPPECWVTAVGPKGTIVLADTRGYHKGGWARERERVVYTCMFASQASTSPEVFRRQGSIPLYPDQVMTFAVGR